MGVEMQNCPLTRVFVKRASTGLLLFQWIYVSPPPFPMPFPCLPSSFPKCGLFPLFTLHVFLYFYFISVYATKSHFSPSLLSFFALYIPVWIPGFLLALLFLWLILPSLFCFNCHIPFLTHLPFFCPSYLLSPVPPFYPFLVSVLLSYCPMPPHLCPPCNICTASIYSLPYISLWISNVTKCNLGEFNTRQCWPVVSTTNRMWGSLGL